MAPELELPEDFEDLNKRHFSSCREAYSFDRGQKNVRTYRANYALSCLGAKRASKPLSVMDVGCSEGFVLRIMAPHVRRGLGIDISPLPIELAKERAGQGAIKNLEFQACRCEELEEREFDAITCFETIEHVPNPLELLGAIRRRLKAGGTLVLSTPNRLRLFVRVGTLAGKRPGLVDETHVQEFSLEELRALVRSAGFNVIRQSGMVLLDCAWINRLVRSSLARRLAKRLMESWLSIYLGALLPSIANVQLLVARPA